MYNQSDFKLPEDLGETVAHALLDEVFNGGVIDATNQTTLLFLMALSSGDNISQAKLCRITQQSIQLLRHLKAFFNITFKIRECEDDVFSDSSQEEEEEEKVREVSSDEGEQ